VISDGDGEVSALENCVTAACPGLFKLKPVKTTVGRLRTELMQELGESSSEGERDDFMQHFVVHFLERKEFLAIVQSNDGKAGGLVVTKLAEWTKALIPVPPAVAPLSAVESKEENLFLVPLVPCSAWAFPSSSRPIKGSLGSAQNGGRKCNVCL